MSLFGNGAQWASPRASGGSQQSDRHHRAPAHRGHPRSSFRRILVVSATIAALLPVTVLTGPSVNAADDFILMPRAELTRLPTSGSAWSELKSAADASLGTPDLCDQDNEHHMKTLAAALVYARTGTASYATKARAGVMAAIKTQRVGCNNATLSLGRQLLSYVLAADFAELSGTNDSTFRTWLSAIRTKNIGGHSKWYTLRSTHTESANNWGANAGASRIAASLYLGDTTDVASAAKITRGFLGDRGQYAGFSHILDSDDLSWSCSGSASTYTPVNPSCTRSGINVDGAVIADISRGGARRWPPLDPGIPYQLEAIQGLGMQVELLYRNGYSGAWGWSNNALKRMGNAVSRSASAGGTGWNDTRPARQMPWLLNKRYGTSFPTRINGTGRLISFTSWLYGGGAAGPTSPPTVAITEVRPSTAKDVALTGVKTVVGWKLQTAGSGLKRFEAEISTDGGSWKSATLASATATFQNFVLTSGRTYAFRVRAVDTAGRAGAWAATTPRLATRLSTSWSGFTWSSGWTTASNSGYIDGWATATNRSGAKVTFSFTGSRLAWVAPVGPTRGKARVYVDGAEVAVVDQYAASFASRRVVLNLALKDGKHTVVIKALGTSGRPWVAIDALDFLDPR